MTRDEVIALAREVEGSLERFAALVAAHEREEIRQYADEFIGSEAERNNMFSEGYDHALYHLKQVLDGRDRRQQ